MRAIPAEQVMQRVRILQKDAGDAAQPGRHRDGGVVPSPTPPGRSGAGGGRPGRPRMRSAAMATAVLAAMLLPGCGGGGDAAPPAAAAAAPAGPAVVGRFDPQRSAALLAEARAAESAGNPDEAERLYRAAGLAWPDNTAAWQGLAALARQRGAQNEAAAAGFMLDRIRTYPSDQLYVQREVNVALKQYIADQRALPEANPEQIALADTLTEYYDALYAARGLYQPPSGLFGTGYGNIENRELPAAIVSGGAAAIYFGVLAAGSGSTSTK